LADDRQRTVQETRKSNTNKEDRIVRALEATRLLAFDSTEGSKKASCIHGHSYASFNYSSDEDIPLTYTHLMTGYYFLLSTKIS
jgi:hypothetical protein